MMDYYISDFHFEHNNIIKYTGRTWCMNKKELCEYNRIIKIKNKKKQEREMKKFKISDESTYKHNEIIIRKFNERVNPSDRVWYLGDFAFNGKRKKSIKYFLDKLNGKIIFITGNHDRKKRNGLNSKVESIRIKDGKWLIWMTHNPRHIRFDYFINFCGHVHEKWKFARVDKNAGKGKFGEPIINTTKTSPNGCNIVDVINMSVDVWDFYPRNINEIKKSYWQWRNKYEEK